MKRSDKSTARLRGKVKKINLREDRHGFPFLNVLMTCPLTLPGGRKGASMITSTLFATRKSPHLPEEWYNRIQEGDFIELTGEFESYAYQQGDTTRQAYQVTFPHFTKTTTPFDECSDFAMVGTVVRIDKNLVTLYVDKSYTRYDGVFKEVMCSFDITFTPMLMEREAKNLTIGARYEIAGMIVQGYYAPAHASMGIDRFARAFQEGPVEKVREDMLLGMYARRIPREEEEEEEEELDDFDLDFDDDAEDEYASSFDDDAEDEYANSFDDDEEEEEEDSY